MSTLNLEINSTEKNNIVGVSYEGKKQLVVSASLHERESSTFCNPSDGGPSSLFRLDQPFSIDDEFNLNDLHFEYEHHNLDATLSQTVFNPYTLFNNVKLLINNQEVCYYDSADAVYAAQSDHWNKFSGEELKREVLKIFPSCITSLTTGETIAPTTYKKFSLPMSVIFPFMKNISRSQGVSKISIEVQMRPNTNTTSSIASFIKSSTTNNPYTSSTIAFKNVQFRMITTKHTDASLRAVPAPIMFVPRYETRTYTQDWNSNAAQRRIQLSQEFSHHTLCHQVKVWAYNKNAITTYNHADAGKIDSDFGLFGYQVKYKSRDIINFPNVDDKNKRAQYHLFNQENRYGKVNPTFVDGSGEYKYWSPQTLIDFQGIHHHSLESIEGHSGLSNAGSEIEIVLTNAVDGGTYGTNVDLKTVLCYHSIVSLNPQTGLITRKNV